MNINTVFTGQQRSEHVIDALIIRAGRAEEQLRHTEFLLECRNQNLKLAESQADKLKSERDEAQADRDLQRAENNLARDERDKARRSLLDWTDDTATDSMARKKLKEAVKHIYKLEDELRRAKLLKVTFDPNVPQGQVIQF